ncbi:MAG: hypothetical protein EMLJLAPB_00252 [Candidatus Argoarchaeum ethanivorans]|uniref:Uncharacterized protein n=1 Tax=Candidatus Argoarchaeum ethanivorans TaxID=2608793 RepID=A0A811TCL5_9EURY|nr:MAG: hypothetical protein EMLJLAPB_00252 [Candidatus Argoarchaeum ethanivorans]
MELKNRNAVKFIQRTAGKVTLFAELTGRGIQVHDNNNHVENPMQSEETPFTCADHIHKQQKVCGCMCGHA